MNILGSVIQKAFVARDAITQRIPKLTPIAQQKHTLDWLLQSAAFTKFGEDHDFLEVIRSKDQMLAFRSRVPVFTYQEMQEYWKLSEQEAPDIAWPGKVKYFALSSGTSGSPSKHIPVTRTMIQMMRKTAKQQLFSLVKFEVQDGIYLRNFLSLGGSTNLIKEGRHFKGDVSGINGKKIPPWFRSYYKPERDITNIRDWTEKLEQMTLKAKDWDVGVIAGVPSWVQLFIEKVIHHYKLKNIHEIWPNLQVYAHGGVAIHPYVEKLKSLFGKEVVFIETYLASEGFMAIQNRPDAEGMKLMCRHGIFYEFIPFTDEFFDADGNLKTRFPETLTVEAVKENVPYAILITTCSGAWRYLIGDVVKFVSLDPLEIKIDGRTKHFLSLCGEHVSVDNMTQAFKNTCEALKIFATEFTVTGERQGDFFAHHWYVGSETDFDTKKFREMLDQELKKLNDDYEVERISALKDIFVDRLPPEVFIEFLKSQGRIGDQIKFPRVLKGEKQKAWEDFVSRV